MRGRVATAVELALGGLAAAAWRRRGRTLLAAALLAGLGGLSASRLGLDADVMALLPEGSPSLRGLERLEARLGGMGFLVTLASGASPEALRAFCAELAGRLEALPAVRYVERSRPTRFLADRALYFLDDDELDDVHDQIEERLDWEHARRNPLFITLDEDEPPPDLDALERRYRERLASGWGTSASTEDDYLDPERRQAAVLVKPKALAANLDDNERLVAEVRRVVADLDPGRRGISVGLTGRYVKRLEVHDALLRDLGRCSLVALLLVVAYLAVHFRRVAAVALVVAPLCLAIVGTLGVAAAAFSQLNILTGLCAAILMGLGIDHGIHLLGRYEAERARPGPAEDAVRRAFSSTGRGVLVAALTTLAAFAAVALSDFRAFREFGVVSGVGLALAVLAYAVVLPALLGVAEGLGWRPRVPAAPSGPPAPSRRPVPVLALTLAALLALGLLAPQVEFDYDFDGVVGRALPSYRLDREVDRLLGYDEMPLVVLTDDEATERAVATALRDQKTALGRHSRVRLVASLGDLVPAGQDGKRSRLDALERLLRRVRPERLEPEARASFSRLETMARAQPWSRADLPEGLTRAFQPPGAPAGHGGVLVYPAIRTGDGRQARILARELRAVPLPDGRTVTAAGEMMVMANVLDRLVEEAPPVLGLTLLLVVACLALLVGGAGDAALCLLPAGITLGLLLGLLPLAGVRLTYLNVVFVPVLFGVAVDGGVHLVLRVRGGATPAEAVGETGRAVAGAILTTGLGFAALLLAGQPGLRAVARLMLMGLAVNLLACLVVLPAALALVARRAEPVR